MSEPAAILATFSNIKLVQTRKVAQLVFEIPIEQMEQATKALGWPSGDVWFGIAKTTKTTSAGGTTPMRGAEEQSRERLNETPPADSKEIRRFMAMTKDDQVIAWLNHHGWDTSTATLIEQALKECVMVASKTELREPMAASRLSDFGARVRNWHFERAA